MLSGVRKELPPMLRLALPVIAAELGWVTMGLVDTIMVGRVSPVAIGAVSIGGTLFATVLMFAGGLLLGIDPMVSQAFGAGNIRDCHRSLLNAIYLYLPLPPIIMLLVWWLGPGLQAFGVDPEVAREANRYLEAIAWGSFPLLLYFALRHYLQSMNLVKPVMFALISANAVHLVANWILIYGNWGSPPLGAKGAGWATCLSRVYMAACLLIYIFWRERRHPTGWREVPLQPDWPRIRRLLALGLPAAIQISLEVGVFATATALVGRLTPVVLAAHQIALNCATFTYMVPLGIGSAASVRVGQAIGRRDPEGARFAGWTAILLGAFFMSVMAVVFSVFPTPILRIFTNDSEVIRVGIGLLFVAALFQLFDGIQTVSTGALRGLGDTMTPMFCNLVGYWVIGLPIGYWLCFSKQKGAPGLWMGLCFSLILIGATLLFAWKRKSALVVPAGSAAHGSAHPPDVLVQ